MHKPRDSSTTTNAADWRPHTNERSRNVLSDIIAVIQKKDAGLVDRENFAKDWLDHLGWSYKKAHWSDFKRVSVEFSVYWALKKMCWASLQMDDKEWNQHNFASPSRMNDDSIVDQGYIDWLRNHRPDYFDKHAGDICASSNEVSATKAVPTNTDSTKGENGEPVNASPRMMLQSASTASAARSIPTASTLPVADAAINSPTLQVRTAPNPSPVTPMELKTPRSHNQQEYLQEIEERVIAYYTNLVLLGTKRSAEKRETELDALLQRRTVLSRPFLSENGVLETIYGTYKGFEADDDEAEAASKAAEQWYHRHKAGIARAAALNVVDSSSLGKNSLDQQHRVKKRTAETAGATQDSHEDKRLRTNAAAVGASRL